MNQWTENMGLNQQRKEALWTNNAPRNKEIIWIRNKELKQGEGF